MNYASIDRLRECVVRCSKYACPFRNTARGYYPKPPKGPANADVMIIFENPGSPSGRNMSAEMNPEMAYDISNTTLSEILRLAIQGQQNWLFEHQGADEDMWAEFGFEIGKTIYTTDSHKCPDPKDSKKSTPTLKERARVECMDYLQEEIRLVQPKAIVACGRSARKSLAALEGITWDGEITALEQEQRVQARAGRCYALLPHPGWYNKFGKAGQSRFNSDVRYVFAKIRDHPKNGVAARSTIRN